jgi:hypothetical protein
MPVDSTMIRSLADVSDGEQVRVVAGLFDVVRDLCPAAGFSAGDTLRCEGHTVRHVRLRRTDGREVSIDRFYASFIEVQPVSVATVTSAQGAVVS